MLFSKAKSVAFYPYPGSSFHPERGGDLSLQVGGKLLPVERERGVAFLGFV